MIYESITEIAEKTESSEASVIRMCRKLGYKGFQDLKINIARNFVTPLDEIHEGISSDDTAASIMTKSFRSTIETLNDTEKILDAQEFSRAADAILNAKHVYAFGLGSSAPVAADIAHKFLRCGICSHAYSDNHFQIIVSCSLEPGDVVIGVSHSGNSKDVVEALVFAKKQGAVTICLTNYAKSPITKENASDIKLYTSSAETKYRVHGLASRIAQLAIADALFVYASMKKGDAAIRNIKKVDQGLTIKKY
jgi:DNA-binding MurR/RpiR family transcriptional regulator